MQSKDRLPKDETTPSAGKVGKVIRALRQQRHVTQSDLGRRIGMRPKPMNNMEQGRCLPSTPVLCRIAVVLDVSVDVLLGRLLPYVREDAPGAAVVREGASTYTVAKSEVPARYHVAQMRPDFSGESVVPSACPVRLLPGAESYSRAMLATLEDLVHVYLALEDYCGATKRAAIPIE